MNLEGACALALVLWIALRSVPGGKITEPHGGARQLHGRDAVNCALICGGIAVFFWRAAHIGFLGDDFILVTRAGDFDARQTFASAGGDGFYRPLVYTLISWTSRWAGTNPVLWHWQGLAIHAVNAVLLYLVVIALGYARFIAGFAAALFAVHGTSPEVAIWVAGRFDLFATMFTLSALLLFVRGYSVAALIAMIAAVLCKESAYAFPLMLVALGAWRRSVWFFVTAAAMFVYRWYLFGGIGGYNMPVSVFGVVKGIGLRMWAVLFVPMNWSIRPGVALEIGLAICAAALVWASLSRANRWAIFVPLGLTIAAAIPVAHLLLIGPDLEKSRYLYLASAMFAVMLAAAIDASRQNWMVAAAVLAFHAAVLEHNLTGWEHTSAKAQSACEVAASAVDFEDEEIAVLGLPQTLKGVYFFENGLAECLTMRSGRRVQVSRSAGVNSAAIFRWDGAVEELKRERKPTLPPPLLRSWRP